VLYGVGASILLAVGGLIAASFYLSDDTGSYSFEEGAPNPVRGAPCKKSGIRYSSPLRQKVYVCFTLNADRSEYLEYGWEFGRGSGCSGGGTYTDSGFPLGEEPPSFTATIVGARASGVVEDSDVCPGKTFEWTARSAP
jgi:hypothetical protein